jgi:PAS domain S-box-containing protein
LGDSNIYEFDRLEADYNRLFEESPIPMLIYNTATLKFISVNAAAIAYYGFSRNQFLQMRLSDIRKKDAAGTNTEVIKVDYLNSFYDSGRQQHIKKNGEIFYVQVYSHAATFSGRQVRVMLALDINNRVVSEQKYIDLNNKVREQKRRLDDILSSVSDVVWSAYADASGFIYINGACKNVIGYNQDEILNEPLIFFNIIHPDDVDMFKEQWEILLVKGKVNFEYRIIHKDGTIRYINNHAVLIPSGNHEPAIINGIAVDITGVRLIEEASRENAKQIESIFESITDAFFALDKNWNFTYANKAFELTTSRKTQDLIGNNIWQRFHGLEHSVFYKELAHCMNHKESVHFEDYMPLLKKWFSINAYPAKSGISVYLRDISEEKNQQLKIQAQNETLKEISWVQSHKMRAPVASILALAEVFNLENLADPINKEVIENIRKSTYNLDTIIKEIVQKASKLRD